MARIHYDTEQRGKLLMRTLAGYLSHAIEEFPVDPQTIYELVVVGNSTMRDLFFRQNVYSIGQSPYQSITEIEMAEGKRDHDQPGGQRPPAAAADPSQGARLRRCRSSAATSAPTPPPACSPSIWRTKIASSAIMDIGTNTELHPRQSRPHPGGVVPGRPGVRGRRDRLRHAGARRRDRRRRVARRRHVRARRDRRRSAPKGICGSGLVDLLSELLRTGRMNAMGRFEDGESTRHARPSSTASTCSRATSTSWPRPRAPTSPGCRWCSTTYGIDVRRHRRVLPRRRVRPAPATSTRRSASA